MFLQNPKRSVRFFKKYLPGRGLVSFLTLCLVLFLLIESIFMLERSLRPAILSLAEIKANMLAQEAVNLAIMEKVVRNVLYQDLLSVKQDDRGKIVMVQVNTQEINRLMVETTMATQEALHKIGEEPVTIPLGEVLDNYLLAAYGPGVKVKLIPAGRVNTSLQDSFEAAGINQVRHKIYLEILTEVRVVVPFTSTLVEVQTAVPLADALYPGAVPDMVFGFPGGTFNLDRRDR